MVDSSLGMDDNGHELELLIVQQLESPSEHMVVYGTRMALSRSSWARMFAFASVKVMGFSLRDVESAITAARPRSAKDKNRFFIVFSISPL